MLGREAHQREHPKACTEESLLTKVSLGVSARSNRLRHKSTITVEPIVIGHAKVVVTDLQGRVVAELYSGRVEAGAALVLPFRPVERNGGAYLYRIRFNGEELIGRMMAQP